MLITRYREGILLRMMNKDSVKHIQNMRNTETQPKSEYQTFRIFAILGALTLVFVLLIRIVQNGPGLNTPRQPSNSLGVISEIKPEIKK